MKHVLRITFLLLAAPLLAAAQDWSEVKITATPLTEQVVLLEGRGGNMVAFHTEEGVFLIDGQFAELNDKIRDAIAAYSDMPVRFLLNTHWHGDHTGGNAAFAGQGATIIAHERVRDRLASGGRVEYFDRDVPPQPEAAIPQIVFTTDVSIPFAGQEISVMHVPAAHTDGDAIVYFKDQDVLHMGDVYFAGQFPFVDLGSGGSVSGVIDACDRALAIAGDSTRVVPGHGPLSNRAELKAWTDMLRDVHAKVAALKSEGAGLETVVAEAASITGPYEEAYAKGFISAKDLLSFIWYSLP